MFMNQKYVNTSVNNLKYNNSIKYSKYFRWKHQKREQEIDRVMYQRQK